MTTRTRPDPVEGDPRGTSRPSTTSGTEAVRVRGVNRVFPARRGPGVQALVDVDLEVAPGEFVSLIGPSGCGKTSLIDVISGRKNTGSIAGAINFGGAPCAMDHRKHLVGYVEQFDNLVGDLDDALEM